MATSKKKRLGAKPKNRANAIKRQKQIIKNIEILKTLKDK